MSALPRFARPVFSKMARTEQLDIVDTATKTLSRYHTAAQESFTEHQDAEKLLRMVLDCGATDAEVGALLRKNLTEYVSDAADYAGDDLVEMYS